MKNECRKLKAKNNGSNRDKSGVKEENIIAVASVDEVFIACDETFVNLTSQNASWIVDSAASFHVCSRRELFTFYKGGDFGVVKATSLLKLF